MVDVYHLFKVCATTAKLLKASKGTYNAAMIFKSAWKPVATMGALGFADAACEEMADKVIESLSKENK